MKTKFSKRVKYTPEFDDNRQLPSDEQVIAWIKPLKLNDLLIVMDSLQAVGGDNNPAEESTEGLKSLIDNCGVLIPQYCEVQNLLDADDEVVTAEDLTLYPFFMGLAAELLTHMATISMPDEDEIKNLKAQQDTQAHPLP